MKTITIIFFALALSACTSTPSSVRGESAVDDELKNDTYQMVKVMASAEMKCKNIEYAQITASSITDNKASETWVANGCGKSAPFNVSFIPAVSGGYTYQITSGQ